MNRARASNHSLKTVLLFALAFIVGISQAQAGQTPPAGGMILWLKADALNLASGGPVITWPDSSGSGNDATNGVGSNQPSFQANNLNGLPSVFFDGARFLRMPGGFANFSAGFSAFTVVRAQNSPAASSPGIFYANNTIDEVSYPANATETPIFPRWNRVNFFGLIENGDLQHFLYEPTNFVPAGPPIPPSPASLVTGNFSGVLTIGGLGYNVPHFNGVVQRGGTPGLASPLTRAYFDTNLTVPSASNGSTFIPHNIFRNFAYIGSREGANSRFAGDMHEIILYKRELSDAERTVCQKYMVAKWGIGPPYAENDALTTLEDTALNYDVLQNDFIGKSFQVVATQPASGGSVTVLPTNVIRFTPAANYSGVVTFTYTIRDLNSLLTSTPGTVTITVTAVNDEPITGNDSFSTLEDTPLTIPTSTLLANDSDPIEGSVITVTNVQSPSSGGGSVFLSGGQVIYTPGANFSGVDTFIYQITDAGGAVANGTVTINVANVDNDPPLAVDDLYNVRVNPTTIAAAGVLSNDKEFEGSLMTALLVSPPVLGTVVFNADGSFTYRPNPGFVTGSDFFTYQVSDGTSLSNVATVVLTVFLDSDGDGIADNADDDTDNDGFPDTMELALGTSPTDGASTPFNGQPAGVKQSFNVSNLQIKLAFNKTGSDTISVSGTLPLPNGMIIAGTSVVFSVGGICEGFTLDAKGGGRSTRNLGYKVKMKELRTFGTQNVGFNVKFAKSSFNLALFDEGLGNQTVKNLEKVIIVDVLFHDVFYRHLKTVHWTAKRGVGGIAR